jgi:hypothetical protein
LKCEVGGTVIRRGVVEWYAVRLRKHVVHNSSLLLLSVRVNSEIETYLPNCTASYPGEGQIKVLLSLEMKNFGGNTPHATIQNNDFSEFIYF